MYFRDRDAQSNSNRVSELEDLVKSPCRWTGSKAETVQVLCLQDDSLRCTSHQSCHSEVVKQLKGLLLRYPF